jgi:hypothetical protein
VYTVFLPPTFSVVGFLGFRVYACSFFGCVTGFDTKAGEYPSDLGEFDGVLITGSLSGVYDGEPWIQRLLHVRPSSRYPSLFCFKVILEFFKLQQLVLFSKAASSYIKLLLM